MIEETKPSISEPVLSKTQVESDAHAMSQFTSSEDEDDGFSMPSLLPEGVEWSAGLASILLVYVVQGAGGATSLAQTLFLKDTLGLDAAATAALTGLAAGPWVIKPLYGILTDTVPILGKRRQPYLVAAGLLGTLAWLGLGTAVTDPNTALLAIGARNLAIAFADVVVDSLCVETARREAFSSSPDNEQRVSAGLQSLCWSSRFVGGLAAAAVSGPLLEAFTPQQIFLGAAALPLAIAASSLLVEEEPAPLPTSGDSTGLVATVNSTFVGLRDTVLQRSVWVPLAIVLFLKATPSAGDAFFFFLTDDLGVSKSSLGQLKVIESATSLLGVQVYQRFFADAKLSRVIGTASITSALLSLPDLLLVTHTNRALGIPDGWLIYGGDALGTAVSEFSFMPCLTLAARLCPAGQEGTFFALLMSAYNFASISGVEIGAFFTKSFGVTGGDFQALPTLLSFCALTSLLPLPLLPLLDNVGEQDASEEEELNGQPHSQ